MTVDHRRALALIVGLGAGVTVTDTRDCPGGPLEIGVELTDRPCCAGCGGRVWAHGSSKVRLIDLRAFGRPTRLVWNKHRWRCPDSECSVATFTEQQPAVALPRARVTSRAARHAVRRAGQARSMREIAAELGCAWRTAMAAVRRWGRTCSTRTRPALAG